MDPNRVLVLYAHATPHLSRVNRRLADAARLIEGVYVHDLYEAYPDFYIDAARERILLAKAAVVVLLHPIQWYGMPALMKEWFDVVLDDAWAHGPDGSAVNGKACWLVATTAAAAAEFAAGGRHGRPFGDFLAPLEQSAAVSGMQWIAPHVLHGAHQVDADAVDRHIAAFAAQLQRLAGGSLELGDKRALANGT
jgi:glutathione-regulated potassium-efflux system ancillary protein KefF